MTIRVSLALGALLMALAALAAPAAAQDGVQTLHFEYGPVKIAPGQNTIEIEENAAQAAGRRLDHAASGRTSTYKDGSVPRVDVIHLHHGVWLSNFKPLFAAGEEKTEFAAPPGYGWRYRTTDPWHMNHMIHNLTPTPTRSTSPTSSTSSPPRRRARRACARSRRSGWTSSAAPIPCSTPSAARHGGDRRLTYPDEVPRRAAQRWTVPEDGALVGTAGHLHPGGLWTDLELTRDGPHRAAVPLEGEVLRAGRARCRGTSR